MTSATTDPHTGASASPVHSCGSACDHHDHGPRGDVVVSQLGSGYAVLAIALPLALVLTLLVTAAAVPLTAAALGIGIALGALQLAFAALAERVLRRPLLQSAALATGTEALRLGAVALVATTPILLSSLPERAVWVGLGAIVVPLGALTLMTVSYRRALARPSDLGRQLAQEAIERRVSGSALVLQQALGAVSLALWAVGATVLLSAGPALALVTGVLAFATSLAGRITRSLPPHRQATSPFAYAGVLLSALVFALALLLAL